MASAQTGAPLLEDVLRVAGGYVADYEQTLALVAEEEYSQQVTVSRRILRSDILIIKDDTFGWVEFRDVAARDGITVRDREDRLLALFTKPHPDRITQAQRIVAEGARFNLDPPNTHLNRTLNLPLTALRFLRTPDQYRSSFRIARWNERTGMVSLEFTERHRPRLIGTPDNAAARGWFEIVRSTGRPTLSTLMLQSGPTLSTVTVQFAADGNVGRWLPRTMTEEYRGGFNGIVSGVARYSRYRQFRVETSERVK